MDAWCKADIGVLWYIQYFHDIHKWCKTKYKLLSRNYSSYWNLYCRVYTYKSTDTVIFKWILKTLHLSCWVIIDYVQTPPLFFQMRLAMLTQWYSLSVKETSGNRLREYCENDLTMLHSPWLLHACTDSEIKYRTPDSCIVFAISKQKLLNIYIIISITTSSSEMRNAPNNSTKQDYGVRIEKKLWF